MFVMLGSGSYLCVANIDQVFDFSRMASRISALSKEMPINAITKENGKAPMIIAVLIADRPPARSNTAPMSMPRPT